MKILYTSKFILQNQYFPDTKTGQKHNHYQKKNKNKTLSQYFERTYMQKSIKFY